MSPPGRYPGVDRRNGRATVSDPSGAAPQSRAPAAAIALIGRGAAVQLAGNIVVAASALISTALAVRLLPPLQYGVLALALAALAIITTILLSSLDLPTTRAIAAAHARADIEALARTIRGATTIGILASAVGGVVVSLVLISTRSSTEPLERAVLLVALALTIAGRTAAIVAQWFTRGTGELRYLVVPTAGMALILVASLVALAVAGQGEFIGIAVAYGLAGSVGIGLALLVGLRAAHGLAIPIHWLMRPSLEAARGLVLAGGPYVIAGLAAAAVGKLDVFVLGLSHGPAAVAQYEPALRLVDGLLSFVSGLLTFFVPVATRLYLHGNTAGFRVLYLLVSKYAFGACFGIFLVLLLTPDLVVRAVYGPAFELRRELIWILLVGYGVNIALGANLGALASTGKMDAILRAYAPGVVAMVVSVVVLVPSLGALGAALATTLFMITLNVSVSVWLYRTSGVHPITRPMITLWGTAAATVVGGLFLVPAIPSGATIGLALPVALWGLWTVVQFAVGASSISELRLLGTRSDSADGGLLP